MVTGCVVETSDPRVFILHNTVSRPEIRDLPRTFKLVQADTPVDVVRHVNHQVHATGRAQVATPHDPVPGDRLAPRELPAFAVQTIQSVSERCLTGQR
jgi:hypothetical protein